MNNLSFAEDCARFEASNYEPGSIHETFAKDEIFEKHGQMPSSTNSNGPGLSWPNYLQPNYVSTYQPLAPSLTKTEPGSLCWCKIYKQQGFNKTLSDWVLCTVVQWLPTEDDVLVVGHDDGVPVRLAYKEVSFMTNKPPVNYQHVN